MRRVLLTLVALAPLAACATAPQTRSPDVRVPAAFEAPKTPPSVGAASLDRWWTLYSDAELQRLIDRALVNSPDAKTAEARLREARANRNANLRLAYPQTELTGSATQTNTRVLAGTQLNFPGFSNSGQSQSYSLGFDVSWEVDLFGRVREGRRLIESDYAANRFDIEGTRASLVANVADALFQARGLAIQLADSRETVRIRRDLNDITRQRAERGLGAASDQERTAADLAQAEAAASQVDADLKVARRQLLLLVGDATAPLASLEVGADVPALPPTPEAVPGELLQRRPDVREAEQRLAAAISQYKVDQLELFPKFTLRPGVGLSRADQPSFSSTTARWSLGAGVSVPVLDRPRLKQLIKVSGARADEAVIAYERVVQVAYAESENALTQLASDRNRVALLTAGEAQARSAYQAARTRYAAGLDDLTSTLSAEQAWRASRTALTSAQVQALRRSVQTFKALGGGWTPPPGGAA